MQLKNGFQLKTGDGMAVVEFKDGTKFIIREGSTVTFTNSGSFLPAGGSGESTERLWQL